MELVKPDIGLLFWMTTCFIILLVLMKRYAWGPILTALSEREERIQTALDDAEEAKRQISEATSKVASILEAGKVEKEKLIKETQSELLIYKKEQENKIHAQIESKLTNAKEEIIQQKREAIIELKNNVAELSIEIAEKILEKELENKAQHNTIISESVKGLKIK